VSSEQDQPQADIDDVVGDDQAKVGGDGVSEDGASAPVADSLVNDETESEAVDVEAAEEAEPEETEDVAEEAEPEAAEETEDVAEEAEPEAAEETEDAAEEAEPEAAEETEDAAEEAEPEAAEETEDAAEEAEPKAAEEVEEDDGSGLNWYILKVQVNREASIRDTLERRVKMEGLEEYVHDIVVPVEEIAEFNRSGQRRIVRKKLYPGYIMVNMVINDDTWFLVRETPGIGDFTGAVGKPTPMAPHEVKRIIKTDVDDGEEEALVKTAIAFKTGDRVRVKDGYFQNFEGDVEVVDQANGRVTVLINIFGRSTPVELEHWQIEEI